MKNNIDLQNERIFNLFKKYFAHRLSEERFAEGGYCYNDGYLSLSTIVIEFARYFRDSKESNVYLDDIKGIEKVVNEMWKDKISVSSLEDYDYFVVKDAIIDNLMVDDRWKKLFHFNGEALKRVNEYVMQDDRFNKTIFTDENGNTRL